ncbi:MAG: peptidylprolyl isomerase [Bacteroidota bacterium]|nr:peptidylprolyl isomerase [Bacteroidota bacterium]MDP4243140.1 peptidylprolyl isomerase [Bacteroidota bacterium]
MSVISTTPALAQKGKKKAGASHEAVSGDKSPWLIKWKGGSVALTEFESAYQRMNGKTAYGTSLDSLKDFLSIYADYRLKLQEAREEGLDKDPKILKEIEGYRHMLAGPYILDKEVTDPAIKAMFERRKWEVRAGHFLASVKNWNDPADTLKAYKRAMHAIKMLDQGYPLSYIAMSPANRAILSRGDSNYLARSEHFGPDSTNPDNFEGSDDKSTAKVGGDLGFFTGGMTVRTFEDAVFSLQPGEYTKVPVRTRYGYHVIYLYEKVPHTGGVHVKHILVAMPQGPGDIDTMVYYRKADSLLQKIKAGANFEDVARESSDDKFSAARGGEMDTISRDDPAHRAEPSFDRAAYNLKDGEISGPVRTTFGYHLIKRINGVRPKTFEETKEQLKQFYKRFFFEEDKNKYLAGLKKEFHLRVDSNAVNYIMARVDSSRTSADSTWARKLTDRSKTIFQIGDVNWTVGALIDTLDAQKGAPLARNAIYDLVSKNIEESTLSIEGRNMATKYPEFEKIMGDYKNGIILFDLENKKVWSRVTPDSSNERTFYEAHKAKFLWPERVDVSEIFVTSDSLAKQLYKRVMAGENFDTIAKQYTERPGFKAKAGHWGLLMKDENELARRAFDFVTDEIKEPFAFQGGYSIVRLNKREPVHMKTFEEARQEVASQYQDDRANELRQQWVEELRTKYGRQINEHLITSEWQKQHGQTPDQSAVVK